MARWSHDRVSGVCRRRSAPARRGPSWDAGEGLKGAELTRLRPRAAKSSASERDAPGARGCSSLRVAHSERQAAVAPPPPPAALSTNQWRPHSGPWPIARRGAKPPEVLPLPPCCLWVLPESGARARAGQAQVRDRLWSAGGDGLEARVPQPVGSPTSQTWPSSRRPRGWN